MSIQIIADSSCDLTDELQQKLNVKHVSFSVILGEAQYRDDENLHVPDLLKAIAAHKGPAASACPSPDDFAQHMKNANESFVITISSKLSGSYNSALVARDLVLEEFPDKKIHVFDSKSASAGETLIALVIQELINAKQDFNTIVSKTTEFINNMKTRFVLDDLSTLMKNGRISKIAGFMGTVLNLRPLMGSNDGEIICIEKIRGTQAAMVKLVENVVKETQAAAANSITLVLTYCNCAQRAGEVKDELLLKCKALREVISIPTGGLSSLYANDGGIILAF